MKIISSVPEMQRVSERMQMSGSRIALVPTMGALHEGHLELVRHARNVADSVIVSIFVNPTQFGPGEDFESYPRRLDEDRARLQSTQGGVDVLFAPTAVEMYPEGDATWVQVGRLTDHLCGFHRPGHFKGVSTIVAKLFLACKPHVAVFGLKDAQQFLVLRRMVQDLHFGVELVGVATVREPDGLALSSRNAYLSEEERREAVSLSRAVRKAENLIVDGERNAQNIKDAMAHIFEDARHGRVQYAEIVDRNHVQPVAELIPGQDVLVAVAVVFGKTRLIDNAFVHVPDELS